MVGGLESGTVRRVGWLEGGMVGGGIVGGLNGR
jgi:hypothetical protein